MHNQVGRKSPQKVSFFSYLTSTKNAQATNITPVVQQLRTNFILDEIKMSISISVYYGWKRSLKYGCSREINLEIMIFLTDFILSPFGYQQKY
jgi:hypothetical protein